MIDEDFSVSPADATKNSKKPKKPVPLPRKHIQKSEIDDGDESTIGGTSKKKENLFSNKSDWKTGSSIRSEVQRIEKSVRNIISKRRSVHPKPSVKVTDSQFLRSNSLPDDNIFCSISFDSPLLDDVKCKDQDYKKTSESDLSSNEGNIYSNDLPPPFPADMPDESVYDEATSITSSDGQCSYVPSSDSNSLYEDLAKYRTASIPSLKNSSEIYSNLVEGPEKSESWSFYEGVENNFRYEVIDEDPDNDPFSFTHNIPCEVLQLGAYNCSDSTSNSNESVFKPNTHATSLVHQFDPLSEKQSENDLDLMSEISESFESILNTLKNNGEPAKMFQNATNPFQNPVILSSLREDPGLCDTVPNSVVEDSCLIEGHYGKVRKQQNVPEEPEDSVLDLSSEYEVRLPPRSTPPPVPPRRFDSMEQKTEETEKRRTSIIGWSSMKRVARMVAENIENRASWSASSLILEKKKSDQKKLEAEEQGDACPYVPIMLNHSGVLFKTGGIQRWGVLSQRKLNLFANKDSTDVKESITIDSVLSIKAVSDKISVEGVQVYCFEISVSSKSQTYIFGAPSASERHIWMRKLLESLTQNFSVKLMSDYTKAGLCYAKDGKFRNLRALAKMLIVRKVIGAQELLLHYAMFRRLDSNRLYNSDCDSFTAQGLQPLAVVDLEGISSDWTPCSILLHWRSLYLSPRSGVLSVADLRKARYLTLQTSDQTCKMASEKGPMLLIDMQDKTLYLQMDLVRETKSWESTIIAAALENGPSLSDQQLTKDEVPTIVEKCVNFIHTHGSLSEGIYRRNGSNQTATKLLAAFRSNAWAVQLTRQNYNEFDVSSVLKRFFRDLPEPLFVSATHSELRTITVALFQRFYSRTDGITHRVCRPVSTFQGFHDLIEILSRLNIFPETHTDSLDEKLEKYTSVLKKLPKINYVTAKRLIGHLYFIDKQRDKNLMGVDNLSAIWGPTLLQVQEGMSLDPNWSRVESSVLNDLITHFPRVFQIGKEELDREMKILEVLETYHSNSNPVSSKKRSGDLKIWVHLNPLNKEDCINISVSPQKISDEICKELCDRLSEPSHLLCLEEVVCNGSLTRPLHFSERIFDTVLRWGYWDDSDRKDNFLVLKKNDTFRELMFLARPPVIFCEELRFADHKSKFFKTYQFEFSQAKLSCYKDKSCSVKIGEWRIEDIVWYIGHEPKRNPHARWSITFIEREHKSPRSKDRPFFGNTICGTTEEQKMRLMAAMLYGQYPQGILPSPNLME